jgi:hypothetical protein
MPKFALKVLFVGDGATELSGFSGEGGCDEEPRVQQK